MTDYWKSTGKYYCDTCKCWTANNRVSIDFHERGKNHQENKRRRILEIKRDSMTKRKKDEKDGKMFQKMEKDALAAVQKDMTDSNGLGRSDMKNIVAGTQKAHSSQPTVDTFPWTAMTAPQGFTYYYNSQTGKSTWETPEVFKKIEENKKKEEYAVHAAATKTEKVTASSTKQSEKESTEQPVEQQRHIHPLLGGWSTIKTNPIEEPVDEPIQPISSSEPTSAVDTERSLDDNEDKTSKQPPEPPRETGKKFKEKVLKTNLVSSDEPVTFKKRKSGSKNVRKRNDDD